MGEEKEDRYAAETLGLNLKEGKLGFFLSSKIGWKILSWEENKLKILSWEKNQLKIFLGRKSAENLILGGKSGEKGKIGELFKWRGQHAIHFDSTKIELHAIDHTTWSKNHVFEPE